MIDAEPAPVASSVLPGLVIVGAVAVGEVVTGDRVVLVALGAVAPLATALTGSVRQVLTVAAAAAALVVGEGLVGAHLWTPEQLVRLAVVLLVGAAAVHAVVLRKRRELALARVTAVAEVAQRAVLRPLPPQVGGVRLAADYHSAAWAARIGGDLYEAVETRYGVRMVIGDVRGSGLGAVRLAAGVLGAFRLSAHARRSLVDVARDLDEYVARDGADEEFVTALLVEFRPPGAMVLSCGHPAPVVLRGDSATVQHIADRSPPLGLGGVPRPVTIALAPGDRLVLYTDGVVEARDAAGAFLDVEHALRGLGALPERRSRRPCWNAPGGTRGTGSTTTPRSWSRSRGVADMPGETGAARGAGVPRPDDAPVVPMPPRAHVAAARRRQARLRRLLRLRDAARDAAPDVAGPRDGGSGVARS